MADQQQLLYDIEVHSVNGIRSYFENGGNPNEFYNGMPLFTAMVEMYLRSPRFKDCVKVFIEFGLVFNDQALLAVLSDDAEKLEKLLEANPQIVNKKYSIFKNTFTPLIGATLLHFCAEYNHVECAQTLIRYNANVNAVADLDVNGFGGNTPIFHTVAQHDNNSLPMLKLLIDNSADLLFTVRGLIWGKGYEWETFVPSVNPLSYCIMGLLPQMHRNVEMISNNISLLLKKAYGIEYHLPNIPNQYLNNA
jgi:hypothetical protein